MNDVFEFSNRHKDLMARDEEYVLGWRYEPQVVFERGRARLMSTATLTTSSA